MGSVAFKKHQNNNKNQKQCPASLLRDVSEDSHHLLTSAQRESVPNEALNELQAGKKQRCSRPWTEILVRNQCEQDNVTMCPVLYHVTQLSGRQTVRGERGKPTQLKARGGGGWVGRNKSPGRQVPWDKHNSVDTEEVLVSKTRPPCPSEILQMTLVAALWTWSAGQLSKDLPRCPSGGFSLGRETGQGAQNIGEPANASDRCISLPGLPEPSCHRCCPEGEPSLLGAYLT